MIAKLEEKSKWRAQRNARTARFETLKKLNSSSMLTEHPSLKEATNDADRIQVLLDENER